MDSEIPNGVIPSDQIINIVLRLPAKSIVRWMSTCKSWYSFVKSSQFISKHLNHSKIKDHRVLIVKEGSFRIFSESDMTLIEQESGRIPFPVIGEDLYILGSCRGLVLVRLRAGHGWLVLLWNPSLEKFKLIDTVMFDWPHGNERAVPSCLCVFALGFLEASNDYRVVRIDKTTVNYFLEDVVDVYSLTTDSWHRVDGNLADRFILPTIGFTSKMAIYINGAAHWIAYYHSNIEEPGYFVILLFDFDNEVFKLIKLPVPYYTEVQESYSLELKEFDGKLALFGDDVNVLPYECSILTWVMMNYPLVESWTERHGLFEHQGKQEPQHDCLFVYQRNQVLWPVIYTKKGNCVFRTLNAAYKDSLLYYNAREDKVSHLGVATPYICPIIVDFAECLVFLDVENALLDHTP